MINQDVSLVTYAEYYNSSTDEFEWLRFTDGLKQVHLWRAEKVIVQHKDSTFECIKSRSGGLKNIPQEEMLWIILKAKDSV